MTLIRDINGPYLINMTLIIHLKRHHLAFVFKKLPSFENIFLQILITLKATKALVE